MGTIVIAHAIAKDVLFKMQCANTGMNNCCDENLRCAILAAYGTEMLSSM